MPYLEFGSTPSSWTRAVMVSDFHNMIIMVKRVHNNDIVKKNLEKLLIDTSYWLKCLQKQQIPESSLTGKLTFLGAGKVSRSRLSSLTTWFCMALSTDCGSS